MDAIAVLGGARIVPVLVINDEAEALPVGHALVAGGLPVVEVTFRTAAAPGAIKQLATVDGLIVGAGTVINATQVDQAADAGARFVVSPGLSREVVERCRERGLPVLPGVATASEIMEAIAMGIEVVKFFPAGILGGPGAIKALAAPFPQLRFIPTGGVTTANLADYLSIPAVAAVGGSWMVEAALVGAGDTAEITARTQAAVAAAAAL